MFRLFAVCLLIFAAACTSNRPRGDKAAIRPKERPPERTDTITPAARKPLVAQMLDSLARWQQFGRIFYRDTADKYAVFVDNASGDAVLCDVYKGQLTIYNRGEKGWAVDSTYAWDGYPLDVERADLDGTGQEDIRITDAAQINGNSEVFLIIADSNGRLRYHPEWTHWNSQYDFKTGRLYCFFTGGSNANGKEIYAWKGDSLQLVEALDWNFNGYGGPPTMERYTLRKGRKIFLPTPRKFSEDYIDTGLFTIYSLPW